MKWVGVGRWKGREGGRRESIQEVGAWTRYREEGSGVEWSGVEWRWGVEVWSWEVQR